MRKPSVKPSDTMAALRTASREIYPAILGRYPLHTEKNGHRSDVNNSDLWVFLPEKIPMGTHRTSYLRPRLVQVEPPDLGAGARAVKEKTNARRLRKEGHKIVHLLKFI